MKIDKKMIDMVLKMNDEQLWKTIQIVASKSGVSSVKDMEKPSDMSKIRSTLASLTEQDLEKAVSLLKKGKSNE